MVRIQPFEVEEWMNEYETTPNVLNIAETCAASVSIDELMSLSEDKRLANPLQSSVKLTYGPIRGSLALRARIAAVCSAFGERTGTSLGADNVLVTQGAIQANFLTLYTLIEPGDHVICVYPTYQQLYSVPESLGAQVSLWKLKAERSFIPDPLELESLARQNTKMIIINNPNNPSGAVIPSRVLRDIVDFAKARNIIVLSDEVYRPLFHNLYDESQPKPPSMSAFDYDKIVVTGSMSKAYALAGLRIGWVASRDKSIVDALALSRDYTTISVSQLDDQVASFALSDAVLPALLKRNIDLAKTNLELLTSFVHRYQSNCSWVPPVAGTTAFIRFERDGKPVDDVQFCIDAINETKAFVVPGSKCFGNGADFAGYVRIGYVCHTEVLREGLEKLGTFVEKALLNKDYDVFARQKKKTFRFSRPPVLELAAKYKEPLEKMRNGKHRKHDAETDDQLFIET